MIDRETAVQWAKDAGCNIAFGSKIFNPEYLCGSFSVQELQAIITRAQNEAYEKAAECCECTSTAHKIRSMKQADGETNAKR